MKKLHLLSLLLITLTVLSLLVSCGGGSAVDADGFAEGLDLYGDNLRIKLTENYVGDKFTAEIIVTDGETFFSSMNDSYWYISVGEQYLNLLASAGKSFSSFEYSDGSYTADSFVYTEEGYEYEILNVRIDFDSEGRVSSFRFEEYEEDGNRVLELKMLDYGKAKAPDEELVVRDDGPVTGPSQPDGPGHAENVGLELQQKVVGRRSTVHTDGADWERCLFLHNIQHVRYHYFLLLRLYVMIY